jgi:phosphoribosylanthranilate isomerase
MRIKVCGIRNLSDALTCIAAGVDALGFLVGITHVAEDKIDPVEARKLIAQLPPFVNTVAVTHLTNPYEICEIVLTTGADTVQLHADIFPENITVLRQLLPRHKLIKCVHVSGREAIETAKLWEPLVDALLLDSRTKERLGGTGLVHDWRISREIVEQSKKPVILAGGLTPENVADAITVVRPYAVDANSGLEDSIGQKDETKVRAFVTRARSVGS